jgi:DNA-binding LytR/AlgR family response regulator
MVSVCCEASTRAQTPKPRMRSEDIECLEADRNYVSVHTPQRTYLLRRTLASLEQSLQPGTFLRVHRSIIVNRAMIRERRAGGLLVLSSGRTVRVSRGFARDVAP